MIESRNLSIKNGSSTPSVIDERAVLICAYVMLSGLSQAINLFGIVTNMLNIACFVKLGFKDTINITLLGLSTSDLCSLITSVLSCIFLTPAVIDSDLPFDSLGVAYLVSGLPHFAFTRVSSCITAMIALEKCISVVAPLRVKSILTPERTVVIMVSICIIFTFSSTPFYVVNRLGLQLSLAKNKTLFGLITTKGKVPVETITFLINNLIIPMLAFVIIAACTLILAVQLRRGQKFTNTAINTAHVNRMSTRNKKIVKMVATISTMFIVCFIPSTIVMVAIAFQPELSVNGKYVGMSIAVSGFMFLMEGINSSMNIFIYHHMSRNYRNAFRHLFIRKCIYFCVRR